MSALSKVAVSDGQLKELLRQPPFPAWPNIEDDEIAAVTRVLKSGKINYWTGREAREFEKEYAAFTRTGHGIALANGTVSLELALKVLSIGPGDEVVTSPRTFIASASCTVMQGAVPVFADVDRDSQNITAASIERVLTGKTKAIILVHLAGWPCEMDDILALAASHGVAVIEDCAQAHGATYKGRPVGGLGTFGSFSFCQDKIISTGGEGGMLVLNDEDLWSRAWAFKDHGKSYQAVYQSQPAQGFRWLHESFGTNWRLTEMQAAIGRLQLKKLPGWTAQRAANAKVYRDSLADLSALRIPVPEAHVEHAYYKFYAFVKPPSLRAGWSRDRIVAEINELGVACFSGSCPEIYLERAFAGTTSRPIQRLPNAVDLGETSLMFLVHPTLTTNDIGRACETVRAVMQRATRG